MLKDLVIALSLANLCFIATWNELLNSPIRRFNTGLAIIINVLVLSALFWIAITLARRSANSLALRLARFFFPLVVLLPIKGFLRVLEPKQKLIIIELLVLVLAVLLIGVFEVRSWHRRVLRVTTIGVLVLFPFSVITVYQAVCTLIPVPEKPLSPPLPVSNTSAPRVLWLLFDEMDQRLAFSDRPTTLHLPELDRLRSQTIYATNAYPPSDSTLVSMPALINGKLLSNAELVNQSKLLITVADSEGPVNWDSQQNLFSQAREAGLNTALVGWYIPYCSLIGETLTNCFWIDYEATTLSESLWKQIGDLVSGIPLASGFVIVNQMETNNLYERRKQFNDYTCMLEVAKRAVTDRDLGLVLVHWPVPHLPGIYNRRKNQFELNVESSYLDNLQLVDRTLGELRRDMEDSGIWDDTILLVSSDHWLRSFWKTIGPEPDRANAIIPSDTDQRVPFLLKLAGQKHAVTYDSVFNNVLIHNLVLALLRSEISSPDSVVSWLDQNRSGRMPYRLELSE